MNEHVAVLEQEVLDLMITRTDGLYVDATYGRGGHARAMLAALGDNARLVVIDRDPSAIEDARRLAAQDPRVTPYHGPFSALDEAVRAHGPIDGVLFDLGVSSPQLDQAARGFSFRFDGPLDMRMDPSRGATAAAWLAQASEAQIADVVWRYGEERHARRIARRIVDARRRAPLTTTFELAELVRACVPRRGSRIDSATRTFQALRIFINDELNELERGLSHALGLLRSGGRLLVIAFHSLEDRIVKQRLRELDRAPAGGIPAYRLLVRKAIQASAREAESNPRARSARLRVLERYA